MMGNKAPESHLRVVAQELISLTAYDPFQPPHSLSWVSVAHMTVEYPVTILGIPNGIQLTQEEQQYQPWQQSTMVSVLSNMRSDCQQLLNVDA